MTNPQRSDLIELRIPCAPEILPMLRAGLPTRSIRLEENGDGTEQLIVIGAQGPLSDPFKNITSLEAERDRYRTALREIRRLWTDPAPAQRQDVAYQQAVRLASEALDG